MGFEILTDNEADAQAKLSLPMSVHVQHSNDLGHRDHPLRIAPISWMSNGLVPTPCGTASITSEVEGGVQMDDILHYKLKGGKLGALLTGWMVHGRVKNIFATVPKCCSSASGARRVDPADHY